MRAYFSLFLIALVVFAFAAALSRRDAGALSSAPAHAGATKGFASRGHVVVRELPPYEAAAGGAEASTPTRAHRTERPASFGPPPAVNAIDSGVSAGLPERVPPVESGRHFEGLSASDNIFADVSPPDPQVAVGPDHVVEMVNNMGRIFDKGGNAVQTFPLVAFFGVPDGYLDTDPRVLYDALSGRWFAAYVAFHDSIISTDDGELEIVVSETSDPTGVWDVYFASFPDIVPDYPGLGVTNDKVTVSVDLYDIDAPPGPAAPGCSPTTGFCGAQTIVLQKSDLLAAADVATSVVLPVDLTRATVRPARSLSSVNDQYLATWSMASSNEQLVMRITGTPDAGTVAEAPVTTLTTLEHQSPPPSRTRGTDECIVIKDSGEQHFGSPPCIDSGDGRMLDAIWRDNRLWTSSTAACTPAGDDTSRSCAHLVEVATDGTPALVRDIMFGAPGDYYSWPAVTTDSSGNVYVSLTRTSTDVFAEARATGRLAGDALNTMSGSVLLRAGEAVHHTGRWGDYLGAATDPDDTGCAWLAGEYAKDTGGTNWGTYIASFSYNGSCGASPPSTPTPTSPLAPTNTPASTNTPVDTPTPPNTPTPTHTPAPTSTSTPAVLRGDANCDGRINSLDALVVLQVSAGIIGSAPCGQGADANHDGRVNALDAALILQVDAGLIPGFPAGGVSGAGPAVRIGSLAQAVDLVGGVTLQALNMPSPGLGAWTIDIAYDGSVVSATSCSGFAGGVCNASFGAATVRVVGAVGGGGYVGDKDLASIAFRCVSAGETALTLTLPVLADATPGGPQPISASTENGTITCGVGASLTGDANCSGTLTAVDAALILQFDVRIIDSLPCPENADVDHNGRVGPIDAALILQFVAGLLNHL